MERTISETEPALVISIQTKNYEVRVYPAEKRGWFEHHIYG